MQEVLAVNKPGDGEGSTWLQLRVGRHKPPLYRGRERNRTTLLFVFTKIIKIIIRNGFYCLMLKRVYCVFLLISLSTSAKPQWKSLKLQGLCSSQRVWTRFSSESSTKQTMS